MRILVCGGRCFHEPELVDRALTLLDQRNRISCLIHGAARGADMLSARWAASRGIAVKAFPVLKEEWTTFGKGAGHRRNTKMLREGRPDNLVAFPGGKGTLNMIDQAVQAELKIWYPYPCYIYQDQRVGA